MMFGAENPNKVKNIVRGQYDHFREIYLPILEKELSNLTSARTGNVLFQQDLDPNSRRALFMALPAPFQQRATYMLKDQQISFLTDAYQSLLQKAVKDTVRWPSVIQSAKGLLTAGPVKSVAYVLAKFSKLFKSTVRS